MKDLLYLDALLFLSEIVRISLGMIGHVVQVIQCSEEYLSVIIRYTAVTVTQDLVFLRSQSDL